MVAALMVLAYPRTPPIKVVPVTVLAPAIVPYKVVPEIPPVVIMLLAPEIDP